MKTMITIVILAFSLLFLGNYCESRKDPYEQVMKQK